MLLWRLHNTRCSVSFDSRTIHVHSCAIVDAPSQCHRLVSCHGALLAMAHSHKHTNPILQCACTPMISDVRHQQAPGVIPCPSMFFRSTKQQAGPTSVQLRCSRLWHLPHLFIATLANGMTTVHGHKHCKDFDQENIYMSENS